MTSCESNNSNAVEVNGVLFKTIMPERILITQNKKNNDIISVQLGISITNNTTNSIRFSFYECLTPELVETDGQILQKDYFMDWFGLPVESDFPLAIPGETITFFPGASIHRYEGENLQLIIAVGNGGFWTFNALKLGKYQIQLKYKNHRTSVKVDDQKSRNKKRIENIWTGAMSMPFIEFSLVQQ